jgi:hypothetical protein
MPIINFAVPATLDKRINRTIKERGFASKAEFFRFAAIQFMGVGNRSSVSMDEKWQRMEREADEAIARGETLGPFRDAAKAIRALRDAKV